MALNCYISWDYDPCLIDMMAYVSSSGYTTIQCSGNYTTTGNTLYPEFWVVSNQDDQDIDGIPDTWEEQIAEKFKPVLHKHSYDKQQGLANFEKLLIDGKFTLKVYNDGGDRLYSGVVSGSPAALHKWDAWHWDTYGWGDYSHGVYKLDLADNVRHTSAPVGQRPIYYHVYKSGSYYYVQYWYYFGMNDISGQTPWFFKCWHESDWEHVSIRLIKNSNSFSPDKVNFYTHEGGRTWSASLCWWSSSNATTYSSIQQGYDESHTYLHIWLSKNAHASYNRYEPVYQYKLNWQYSGTEVIEDYIDNVDYSPSSYDEYFPYDFLEKLGEVDRGGLVTPRGNSKYWIAFEGRFGTYWTTIIPLYGPIGTPSPGPLTMNEENHEYYAFTQGVFEYHWGFDKAEGDIKPLTDAHFYWKPDPPRGD